MASTETVDDERPPGVRLLVIEPDNAFRTSLEAAFSPRWITNVAATATNGLATAAWFRPTVVILDMFESGLSASAFATLLRYGRIDNVFLIGTTTQDQATRARSAHGIDVILFKPLEVAQLLRVIEQRVGEQRA